MAKDVKVEYMSGGKIWSRTYPKIDRIIEGAYVIRLEVKRYPGVSGEVANMKHVISIPYTAMAGWTEEQVDG
jgi:hypothetical protein